MQSLRLNVEKYTKPWRLEGATTPAINYINREWCLSHQPPVVCPDDIGTGLDFFFYFCIMYNVTCNR